MPALTGHDHNRTTRLPAWLPQVNAGLAIPESQPVTVVQGATGFPARLGGEEYADNGKRVARKRVARLMRKAGLNGRCPRRFRRTTIPGPTVHAQDLVQRQFRPSAPNQLSCSDISYIRTGEVWLYLAVFWMHSRLKTLAGH